MFKPLAALIAASTLTVPAIATVDSGTTQLLQTMTEYGVTVLYNPPACSEGWQGQYTTKKVLSLCYVGRPTASDFDTVRHEAFHMLQHCASQRRGERGIKPLAINQTQRQEWVSSVLRSGDITEIKSVYPTKYHQVELEAFAAAAHYDANQLANLVRKWCVK